jgi:hypothetical protein
MKDTKNKLRYSFTYFFYLLMEFLGLMIGTLLIYFMADGRLLIVYIANIVYIVFGLTEEKFLSTIAEKLYNKLKKDSFIKRQVKKALVRHAYTPSVTVTLYIYYLVNIVAERLLYFGVAKDVTAIASYREYLSIMYYSFIFLMAFDKVVQVMNKENKNRKKYYEKFDEGQLN